jgi:hypothetical protein
VALLALALVAAARETPAPASGDPPPFPTLTAEEQAFLDDLERRAVRYFDEQSDPETGLVRDRARADGTPHDETHRNVASIAATGFGLTALCIAADRGWVSRPDALKRARRALAFLDRKMPDEHGWRYHFVDVHSGARAWKSELSSIDTTWLLMGVLSLRGCFPEDKAIATQVDSIYSRVDFQWMLNGHASLLSIGWTPEHGFLEARWDHYSELMALYALAIGSPRTPIPVDAWHAWSRPVVTFGTYQFIGDKDPLFVHQYSHAWIDFRGRRESRPPAIDWWQNSVTATRAHRAFCLSLSKKFRTFSSEVWGITASDGPSGYQVWGGPPAQGPIDGTIVPAAPGGSLMFTPEISLPALETMKARWGEKIYGRYGFVDAFNPATGWVNSDVLGIDLGITLLSAENLRSGKVWQWTMASGDIGWALDRAGVRRTEVTRTTSRRAVVVSPAQASRRAE